MICKKEHVMQYFTQKPLQKNVYSGKAVGGT